MANTSRVVGLKPIDQPYGNIRVTYYQSATGTALYRYQPVDLDANGRVVVSAANSLNTILGTVVSFLDDSFAPVNLSYIPTNPTWTAATSAGLFYVGVADHPNQWYLMEEDTGGSALSATHVGNGVVFTYNASTGNNVSGIANAVIDRSAVGTGTDMTLRLVKLLDKPDNAFGDYAKWVVSINRHRYHVSPPGGPLGTGLLI